MQMDDTISRNFSTLKLGSILMVFFGHFFIEKIPLIWVPVTIGLIIFSFSSGYFTSLKYIDKIDIKIFWMKKFNRLGMKLIVINLFLFVLFLIQQRTGLWTWQTLISLFGLTGLLNWFHIDNPSPFGKGMWYLTLLFIFYAVYPLLNKIGPKQWKIIIVPFLIAAYLLSEIHHVGHALYLTICGFLLGVYTGRCDFSIAHKKAIVWCILSFITMLIVRYIFEVAWLNFILIFIFSICFIFSVIPIEIGKILHARTAFLSVCIFEIYLLHPYLSYHPTGSIIIDFIASISLVLILSMILNHVSTKLSFHYLRN